MINDDNSQTYNVGHRECGKCGFLMHIMFPEYGIRYSDDWYKHLNKYLDKYIEACGWVIDLEHNRYLCAKCANKKEIR